MSFVAAYSAMTLYIMSDAELHIFDKFTALKKSINCPKIQNEANFSDGMLLQSPRKHKERGWESSESGKDSKLQVNS